MFLYSVLDGNQKSNEDALIKYIREKETLDLFSEKLMQVTKKRQNKNKIGPFFFKINVRDGEKTTK